MTLFVFILLTPLLLIDGIFVLEVVVGLRRRSLAGVAHGATATVVIPAHDEASVIGPSVDKLAAAAGADFPIMVVADNCVDDTATIAAKNGAAVIERHDPAHRGKGHALAFAREYLRSRPPAAVIVLDADCRIDRASLLHLAARTVSQNRPSQAINLVEPDLQAPTMVQISTFAFLVKNLIRQRGLQWLTGGVHLTGTGMCLTWDQFDRADLATSDIVEDLRLGLEMRRAGAAPQLVENAFVLSPHAPMTDALAQRSRWEGGFLSIARRAGPAMILDGLRSADARAILCGLDLMVPPLTLLAMTNVAALLGSALLAALSGRGWGAFLLLATTNIAMGAALLAAWWREGRASLSGTKLLSLPLYALWKIPLYLLLARQGAPSEWRRTRRS